jgi:divalent metal cation (Fe/Co/Zn/Cd) transporter
LIGFLFQSSTSLRESAKRVVDLFSVGLFLFSEWISSKPANRIFTYGLGKTSALCSLVNIVIVLIGVLHFLLDTIMPDESANSWYEDTNVEMIMVYTIAVIFYVVLRLMINRKGSGKGPSVKYPE